MDVVLWIILAIVAAIVIGAVMWVMVNKRRTRELQEQFGSEYERALERSDGRRAAETELAERRSRREKLDIRPLDPAARQRYAAQWRAVQSRFVDQPAAAVAEADELVFVVMRARGYPMDDFAQRAADVSVDHPQVVENYRTAHDVSTGVGSNQASTEDMRLALIHYRALFAELLNEGDENDVRHVR